MFTICVEYSISPFHLIVFLKSLENSKYESLMREVKEQVDIKKWVNKDGLPFGAKAKASWIRELILSLGVMIAANKHIIQ